MTDLEKIDELLNRGVAEVIHKDSLKEKLLSGEKLRIKFGVDPTSPNIHLGRAVPLWKLRKLQDLGHQVVVIVGDFTGVIGDTSDKESERPMLSVETVKKNLETYFEQMGKILDMSKVEKHYNTEWLEKLGYREIGEHADVFSLSDFISRENIKKRLDAGKRVSLRELLYPLMQGYDSVAVQADVEVGGTDQKFNILAGRRLQEHFGKEPQNIILVDLIEGLDGRKMSSSWGNTINLTDTVNDMFGKVMSLRDELIVKYFIHITQVSQVKIDEIKNRFSEGENPRNLKIELAEEITAIYYDKETASLAKDAFIATFQKKEIPDDVLEIKVYDGVFVDSNLSIKLLSEVLLNEGVLPSKSEFRRLVEEGAVKRLLGDNQEEKISDHLEQATPGVYKIGKRRFVKIV